MLEPLGVLAHEEELYRSLLRRPRATIEDLAESSGHSVDAAQSSIRRLEDLGLITRLTGSPVRLVPTRPDVAVDVLVARRRQELTQAQAAAQSLLQEMAGDPAHEPEDLVEIVNGRSAVAHRFLQMEETVTTELLVLDRPPYAQEVAEPNDGEFDLLARGVSSRGIYAPEGLAIPGRLTQLRSLIAAGEEARTSPLVPMKMAIVDRSVAILPLSSEQITDQALVVRASTLVQALAALFDILWDLALPVTGDATMTDAGVGPHLDEPQQRLLALLAAGLSDQAIARQLEVSTRTLSRQVAGLTQLLGARTRFQAGAFAVSRKLVG
jgi:sugar-specific transcriptional regulator TrmB/DNA-binding CsgD family transcriptional regulator